MTLHNLLTTCCCRVAYKQQQVVGGHYTPKHGTVLAGWDSTQRQASRGSVRKSCYCDIPGKWYLASSQPVYYKQYTSRVLTPLENMHNLDGELTREESAELFSK